MGKHIHNLATSMIGQLGIKTEDYAGVHSLWVMRSCAVEAQLSKMRPETLGRIVAGGKGIMSHQTHIPMYEVFEGHEESYPHLNVHDDGLTQLRRLARIAIIAEMANILEAQIFRASEIGKKLLT